MDTVYVRTQDGRWLDIGRPVEMTFQLNCIDPAILGMFFGEETMSFKVGQSVLGHVQHDELPVNTVLTGGILGNGDMHFIKQESGEWLHVGKAGNSTPIGRLSRSDYYEIVYLPEGYEPDPVNDLAGALWEIRNQVVSEVIGFPVAWESVKHDLQGEVYRALAEYVIENRG